MIWIIIAVIYVLIGVGILFHAVHSEPWGGLMLEVWWLLVFFYPLLLIKWIFDR
ncbi:hypothetical protein [Priestia megaterium]|uniref:hypothetical protein n=1 Tax=Priestia megaterium TaxID=1404 RepID=UPI0015D4BB91|nr:hypothetical protein [Priestia megaterium]